MIAAAGESLGWLLWPAVIAAAVATDAFFCGMETGVYVVNKARLDLRAEAGSRAARVLRGLLSDSNRLLAVILIGTNLAAYTATFGITSLYKSAGFDDQSAGWYALATATPLLFIFGESVPKNVFQQLSEKLVYRLAWLLELAGVVFRTCGALPLVKGFSTGLLRLLPLGRRRSSPLGHEGVAAVMSEGVASGLLTASQSAMAERVMHIGEVSLADVATPMSRVVWVPAAATREQVLDQVQVSDYSRLPVLDAGGAVVGILNIYDVLADEDGTSPAAKAAAPFFLPAEICVTDALYRLQRAGAVMAIVGRDGETVGLVTVKDLVEEIVGELYAW